MDKDERVKKEIQKFKRVFKNLPKDKKATVEKLMNNAAFMAATLEDLQAAINERGYTCAYKDGFGTKRSPEVDVYNTMIKNYLSVIKQLVDLLPEEQAENAESEFVNFIQKAAR